MGLKNKYNNKYFREVLEKDLQEKDLGVNIHCREDGIHITVPPYPPTSDKFTSDYGQELLRENYDTERIVNKVKESIQDYKIKVVLDNAVYGDNIKIKLKVQ